MKCKVATLLLASLVILLTSTALEDAADRELERKPLKGLTGLWVVVDDTPDKPALRRTIRTVVELELRTVGLKVFESQGDPLDTLCHLHVNCDLCFAGTVAGYAVEIKMYELVHTVRNGAQVLATTWSNRFAGHGPSAEIDEMVEDATSRVLRDFLNDYLAANPRPHVEPQVPE